MVREFHRVIGDESASSAPSCSTVASPTMSSLVGGGSNAAGIFAGFADTEAQLIGAEPAGGAAVGRAVPGIVHGSKSYLMQDEWGQVLEAGRSRPARLSGNRPEHAHLVASGRFATSRSPMQRSSRFQLRPHRGHHSRRIRPCARLDRQDA